MRSHDFIRRQRLRLQAEALRAASERLSAEFQRGRPQDDPNETNSDALERKLAATLRERAKYRHIGQHDENDDEEDGV